MKKEKFSVLKQNIKDGKVDISYLAEIVENNPNDMELGKLLREYYVMELKKKK